MRCFPSSQCRASSKGHADKNGFVVDTDYFIQLYSARPDVCPHRYLSVDKSCSASLPRLATNPGNGWPEGQQQRWRLSRTVAGNSTYYIRPTSCPRLALAFAAACSRPLLSASAAPQASGAAWLFKLAGQHKQYYVEPAGTAVRSCSHKLLSPSAAGWPGATCEDVPVLFFGREQTTLARQLHMLRFVKVDDDRGIAERYFAWIPLAAVN